MASLPSYYIQMGHKRQKADILDSEDMAIFLGMSIDTSLFHSLTMDYPDAFSIKLANLLTLHPPLHIRHKILSLLQSTLNTLQSHSLLHLKSLLLQSFKNELHESLLPPFSKTIAILAASKYLSEWLDLSEYILSCISLNSIDYLNQRKGLMLLADLSNDIIQNAKFLKNHYGVVYDNLKARMLDETADDHFQALTFEALRTMLGMALPLRESEIGTDIFLMLLDRTGRHLSDDIVLKMVQDLGDLVYMGIGDVINGKDKSLFQSMLRIAEKEDASEELRCAAVQVLVKNDNVFLGVIKEIACDDSLMALKVSVYLLSCIQDNSLDSDNNNILAAGPSESFNLGKLFMDGLLLQYEGSALVPMAIDFLKATYAASDDWRTHQAGMIVISALAELKRDEVVMNFVEVENLVMEQLNNGHHRVLWAATNTIWILSECNLIPQAHYQYHVKFVNKLSIIIKCSCYPQIQVEAILAIRSLVTNCRLVKMASFGEEVVIVMLELLMKNDNREIQEEAVETLKSVAVLVPKIFVTYYDTTMESLKAILFNDYSKPKFLLRAKSLEFMSNILLILKIEDVNFTEEDAVKVMMDSLISLEGRLNRRDYLARTHLLKALDQFFQFPREHIDRYINKLKPMVLRSAHHDKDLVDKLLTQFDVGSSDSYKRPKVTQLIMKGIVSFLFKIIQVLIIGMGLMLMLYYYFGPKNIGMFLMKTALFIVLKGLAFHEAEPAIVEVTIATLLIVSFIIVVRYAWGWLFH